GGREVVQPLPPHRPVPGQYRALAAGSAPAVRAPAAELVRRLSGKRRRRRTSFIRLSRRRLLSPPPAPTMFRTVILARRVSQRENSLPDFPPGLCKAISDKAPPVHPALDCSRCLPEPSKKETVT